MADRVLAARAGILAVALCAYVLAALFAERRRHEAALAESEARLQEALTAGAVTTLMGRRLGFVCSAAPTPRKSWVRPAANL